MRDEGTIKFKAEYIFGRPFQGPGISQLVEARNQLFDLGLIGVYDDGISFGNLSIRRRDPDGGPSGFYITGTQTGYLERVDETHIAFADQCDISANSLRSTGPIQASSEAMTHYMIYTLDDRIQAVVHVHSSAMWTYWMSRAPTTGEDVPYGTPAMADAVEAIVLAENRPEGFLVMAGHEDGVLSYGPTLNRAMGIILERNRLAHQNGG